MSTITIRYFQRTLRRVLEPLVDVSSRSLGFCLSCLIEFADVYRENLQTRMFALNVSPGIGWMSGSVIAVGTAKPWQLSALEFDVVVQVVAMGEHARTLGTGELTWFSSSHPSLLPWLLLGEGYYLDTSWRGWKQEQNIGLID